MMNAEQKKTRLLLVDDEAPFRAAAAQALARRGYEVEQAESGEAALRRLREALPDLILLDLRMEGMDGIMTLREIRDLAPELPVVILTGHGRFDDALAGIRLDIVDFVQKPVDLEQLAARIPRLLARERPRPLREKTIAALMRPLEAYQRLYADQSVSEAAAVLAALYGPATAGPVPAGHRALLVYDRRDRFQGLVRIDDIVRMVLPEYLERSPYASFFTGMFLAQCKVIGKRPVGDLLPPQVTVDLDAPLLEAVHLISSHRVINLPVMQGGRPVGILRDLDLFLEIAANIAGEG